MTGVEAGVGGALGLRVKMTVVVVGSLVTGDREVVGKPGSADRLTRTINGCPGPAEAPMGLLGESDLQARSPPAFDRSRNRLHPEVS